VRLSRGPWFRTHPAVAVGVAAALFVIIAITRFLVSAPQDTVLQLLSLPIALLAIAFGRRAGLFAALVGIATVVVWVNVVDVHLGPLGWGSRIVPMLLLGVLVGDAAERLRAAEHRRLRLAEARLRRREAAEINDTIVQNLAVAKWMIESGQPDSGIDAVTNALTMAQDLVADLLDDDDADTLGGMPDVMLPDVRVSLQVPPAM
jgi:signal transduction histidine kinase